MKGFNWVFSLHESGKKGPLGISDGPTEPSGSRIKCFRGGAKRTGLPLARQSAAFDSHFTAENRRLEINWVSGGGLN